MSVVTRTAPPSRFAKHDRHDMRIHTYDADGVTVFVLVGRLVLETFGTLKDHVRGFVERGGCQLVLDLAKVSYVDSIGVSELVRSHTMVDIQAGTVILAAPPRHLTRLLALTHLDTVLTQRQTVSDAVTQLTGDGVIDV